MGDQLGAGGLQAQSLEDGRVDVGEHCCEVERLPELVMPGDRIAVELHSGLGTQDIRSLTGVHLQQSQTWNERQRWHI